MTNRRNRIDVLVVGGGPAGLAAAIRARQSGLGVAVLDRALPPVDKSCGEGLMPDGVERLRELGVELPSTERALFRGLRYVDESGHAEGEFPGRVGYGVRRTTLQRVMTRRAEELGVELRWGVAVRGLNSAGVHTDREFLGARWIVGADGLHSQLRRWAGLEGPPSRRPRFGVRRHYRIEPWSEFVEIHWGRGCEAYVTPVGGGEVGVALLWNGPAASFDELLSRFPSLARRVEGASASSRDRGAGPLEQRVRGVVRGNLALVGDAAGYVDALTGEGLALAFHEAFAVVEAIERGNLAPYADAHRRLVRLPNFMTRFLLLVERAPSVRRRMIRALAADPALFSRLLGVHARALPARRLGIDGARLALRLVAT